MTAATMGPNLAATLILDALSGVISNEFINGMVKVRKGRSIPGSQEQRQKESQF
jgi:hypothetical protein